MARLRGTVTSGSTLHPMTDKNPAATAPTQTPDEDAPVEAPHKPGSGGEWISPFVSWAREEVDTLDFGGAEIPERLAALVSHL